MGIYNWWGQGRVGLRFGTQVWGSGFHGGRLCLPGDTWQCLETVLIVTTREWNANGIEWVEGRDAAKHSTIHRAAPPNKELSAPNCPSYPGWETQLRGVGGGMAEAGVEAIRRKNVLTRTTRLTQVKSKVLAWRQCGRETMGLSKRVGNLAVPPDSMDPSHWSILDQMLVGSAPLHQLKAVLTSWEPSRSAKETSDPGVEMGI